MLWSSTTYQLVERPRSVQSDKTILGQISKIAKPNRINILFFIFYLPASLTNFRICFLIEKVETMIVIPAEAGIQKNIYWMPHQVRHDMPTKSKGLLDAWVRATSVALIPGGSSLPYPRPTAILKLSKNGLSSCLSLGIGDAPRLGPFIFISHPS
jgi:hypothetical protein